MINNETLLTAQNKRLLLTNRHCQIRLRQRVNKLNSVTNQLS